MQNRPPYYYFKRFAHSAEPNHLVVGMLGSWVAVWFSSFLVAVLLSCCLAASLVCLLKKSTNPPQWIQNRAQRVLKWRQKWAEITKNSNQAPKMIPGRPQERSQVIFAKVPRPFSTILGCPLGPGKDQKSTHRPTKCPGWRVLSDFYSIFGLTHFFDWISDRIFMKNRCCFIMIFQSIPHFFQPGDPHKTSWFTYRETLFHFFN